jgi:hypothetical protein
MGALKSLTFKNTFALFKVSFQVQNWRQLSFGRRVQILAARDLMATAQVQDYFVKKQSNETIIMLQNFNTFA